MESSICAPTLASRRHVSLRALTMLMTVMVVMLCLCVVTFASGGTGSTDPAVTTSLDEGIKTGLKSILTFLQGIASAVAAVVFAVRAFGLIGGGQRGMENFVKNVLYLALALIVIWGAPVLVQQLQTWFDKLRGADSGDIFKTVTTGSTGGSTGP